MFTKGWRESRRLEKTPNKKNTRPENVAEETQNPTKGPEEHGGLRKGTQEDPRPRKKPRRGPRTKDGPTSRKKSPNKICLPKKANPKKLNFLLTQEAYKNQKPEPFFFSFRLAKNEKLKTKKFWRLRNSPLESRLTAELTRAPSCASEP